MDSKENIRKRNEEILRRMKDPNDNLSAFNRLESWYPIRKIIKKDFAAMKRLYSLSKEEDNKE